MVKLPSWAKRAKKVAADVSLTKDAIQSVPLALTIGSVVVGVIAGIGSWLRTNWVVGLVVAALVWAAIEVALTHRYRRRKKSSGPRGTLTVTRADGTVDGPPLEPRDAAHASLGGLKAHAYANVDPGAISAAMAIDSLEACILKALLLERSAENPSANHLVEYEAGFAQGPTLPAFLPLLRKICPPC